MKKHSLKYRDRPLHPLDNAAFWVEYVIRHNGAKHLQSPGVHLNFFQYYSLDVIVALILFSYLSWKVGIYILKLLFRKCFGMFRKSGAKNKKE